MTIAKIEKLFQDGIISEVEYIDLLEKFIARMKRAVN